MNLIWPTKMNKSELNDEIAFTRLKMDLLKEKSCMLHIDYWASEGMIKNRMDALMYAFGYFDGSGYDYKLSDEFLDEIKNKDYEQLVGKKGA